MVSHRHTWAKLGRDTAHRLAMLRNMVTSVIKHDRIMTTHTKAKAAQRMTDRMITLGKDGSLLARRKAYSYIREPECVHKVFGELADRYKYRPGGFTRVMHVKNRKGDNADMSYLELVDREGEIKPARVCTEEYHQQKQTQYEDYAEWSRKTRF